MNLFKRFRKDNKGQVAIIFALSIIPIMAVAGFAIDFQNTVKKKQKVQLVMDSAVLAAARAKQAGQTDQQVKVVLQQFMDAQLNSVGGGLTCQPATVIITPGADEIDANISCVQDTKLMQLVGEPEMPFKVTSASEYGIDKLDVAFMIDVSGSMNYESRLTNLKSALQEAIDVLLPAGAPAELIEDTRLSMVSYNSMVNAGDFFEEVTGVPKTRTYTHDLVVEIPSTDVTDTGDEFDDIRIGLYNSQTNNLITYFGDDAEIYLEEDELEHLNIGVTVPWWSDIEDDVESMHLRLRRTKSTERVENGEPYAVYGDSGGNYYDEDWDYGDYRLRIRAYKKDNAKGGKVFDQTIDFDFLEPSGPTYETHEKSYTLNSSCVWERDGDAKFNDDAPDEGKYLAHREAWFTEDSGYSDGGYWSVGHPNRPGDTKYRGNECRSLEPVELTNNRNTLINYKNSLTAGGGTAGHLGIAWSWYLVSENWDGIFDGSAAPMRYDEPDSVKAVILMTDGEFNREIFPEQGSSDQQARELCDKMKLTTNIKIYAVALSAPPEGQAVLSYCASGTDYYFTANSAATLNEAYRKIATSISDLRISK